MSQFSTLHWIITALIVWVLYKALSGNKAMPARYCKACGHTGATKAHTPGSLWIEVILWLCFIVPGLIYWLYGITC